MSEPYQQNLFNKYQINMRFSYFHVIGIYGMTILAPYQIDIVKWCGFSNMKMIFILYLIFV